MNSSDRAMMNEDPRVILDRSPMSRMQVAAVAMCIMLTALDGFDVLSISFAAPGIADEWGINRAALGIVLSMELIGMAFGSVLIGGLADRFGRRPAILGCLGLMTVGMFLAAMAGNVITLSIYRFGTGLGIGGMLASTSAMAAEFSNAKRRNFSVILMAGGYPFGILIGGTFASMLLASFDWRSVFVLGGCITAVFIPLVWWLLPESISYLMHRRPGNAVERINRTLKRMGHAVISRLPDLPETTEQARGGIVALFSPKLARTTILLTAGYFGHIMTFYFLVKWIPKLVADMGYAPSLAGSVLVWTSAGGAVGCVLIGFLALRFNVRKLVIGSLILAAGCVAWFGQGHEELATLSLIGAIAGFTTNAAVVGTYALLARSFPTALRASGTGFGIGVGRGGSVVGPVIAGFLFQANFTLSTVAVLLSMGSILAAILFAFLPPPPQEGAAPD
ncbi:MFS transporter [Elongatibacter sediminis]|uniref:MFS transporter n=1 Tax=Elongatibacter sediminis TaxID=3119006 RepID=A0AAW9RES3_9GAMM